jgi:phospholipase C
VPVRAAPAADRRRAARRRGFVAFTGALVLVIAGLAWATSGDDEEDRAARTGATGSATGATDGTTGPGTTGTGGTGGPGSEISPGETPIEHVVFIVKENRTFNNYFATYPGAEGATEGGTIRCDEGGCDDGPVVQLTEGPDVYAHDLTHCFRCGLVAINDGKMNGFNRMNGVIPFSS